MDIVCNTDDRYIQHCGVMLTSLFENNLNENILIHILYLDLSSHSINCLKEIVLKYHSNILFYKLSSSLLSCLPINKSISISAYLRLFISKILPSRIGKIIYLDCDIIINSSLVGLWNIDISKKVLAAVEDYYSNDEDVYCRLNYSSYYKYFNSGVLLINLNYWRNNNSFKDIVNYIEFNYHRIIQHDQDILNAIFYDKKILISKRWNYIELNSIYDYKGKPMIIHFAGTIKPWHYKCRNSYSYLYYKYLKLTKWASYSPTIFSYFEDTKFPYNFFYLLYLDKLYIRIRRMCKYILKNKI